jgi:hypothetical protein
MIYCTAALVVDMEDPMERLLADLRYGRQRLTKSIEEATSAVDDHHLAWQQLAARYQDCLPNGPVTDLLQRIDQGRRREAYYLGQAVALTWAMQLLDATLRQHSSHAVGRVFSCPLPPIADALVDEQPAQSRSKTLEQHHHDVDLKSQASHGQAV